ncbi:MAG: DUF4386 domain-containing protein [Gammaproteobacteria bacterium]|nr:DUF4386 domain-containing protein [Gammaproteobacteria bacterium]
MENKILRYGALASLGCATTFVFGFILLLTQLMPYIDLHSNPEEAVKFVRAHQTLLSIWNFVIYILFGVLLTVLGIALHHKLSPVNHFQSQLSAAIGLVWVVLVIGSGMLANVGLTRVTGLASVHPEMAHSLWLTIITVKEGLGGGNEIIGGLWVLLVSVTMWRNRIYSRVLSVTGIIAGIAGTLSTISPLSDLGAVFGLLLIIWFVYLGFNMMRESSGKRDQAHAGVI